MKKNDRPLNILLIEDNPLDVAYTKELLKDSAFPVSLHVIEDGKEALAFIHRLMEYPDNKANIPDLIILDLKLPYVKGDVLLSLIKANHETKKIPVFILTTSTNHEDVKKAHKLNAFCYFVKPLDLDEFDKALRKLKENISLS